MASTDDPEPLEGSQQQPIILEDDIDIPQSAVGAEVREIISQAQDRDGQPVKAEVEEDDSSEDPWAQDEAEWDRVNQAIEATNLVDLTEDLEPEKRRVSVSSRHCEHWKKGVRNPCPCGTHYMINKTSTPDVDFKVDQFVELKETIVVGRYQAEFIEVSQIWCPDAEGDVFVRGIPYARTRNLDGRIDPRKNELCALLEIDTNDDRPNTLDQALVEVQLSDIKTVRIVHKTNKVFPECRFDPATYRTKEEREAKAPLTCRWVMTRTYPDARFRRAQRPLDGEELRHYNEDDVLKARHRASDDDRLTTWRRGMKKVRGGSYIPEGAPKLETYPESDTDSTTKVVTGQKYSAVDVFCGAGGFSKGAEMAGFKVLMACDHWSRCCETYRENFPGTVLHEKDVRAFIRDTSNTDLTAERQPVDFVHLSPPCQFYSPAHTCPGKNDEANKLALFDCEYVVLVLRPRLFSVEQTFGLSQERHSSFFNAFVQGFTRNGFSIKWKVLHLVEMGLAQTRKRLFIMGAAPGETLPDWPEPTHHRSKGPPRKSGSFSGGRPRLRMPPVSAQQACSRLVNGWNLHDVEGARPQDRPPWDASRPLERTITTSGGQCYHWSGLRDLTLAEFAALQGFPRDFRFRSKYIKKQIGNAFPPVIVRRIMKHIRNHLEEVDGVESSPDAISLVDLDVESAVRSENRDDPVYRDLLVHPHEEDDLVAVIRESRLINQFQSQNLTDDDPFMEDSHDSNTEEAQVQSTSAVPPVPSGSGGSQDVQDDHHSEYNSTKGGEDWDNIQERVSPFKKATFSSRKSSSGGSSVIFVGETSTSRPGSSLELPIVVEDLDVENTATTVPGSSFRPVTPEGSGGRLHGSERDGDLWGDRFGGMDEDAALNTAIKNSIDDYVTARSCLLTSQEPLADDFAGSAKGKGKAKAVVTDDQNGSDNAVSRGSEARADAFECPDVEPDPRGHLAISMSKPLLEGPDDPDRGKGKEARTFDEYDRGQDNESPKGRQEKGTKRYYGYEWTQIPYEEDGK